jgi:N-methylhydantoinase A
VVIDDGTSYSAKAPSTPGAQHEGVLAAIAAVLEKAGVEPRAIGRFAHGMTVATNALLQGVGAKTALIATDGFTDVVELGRQARPSLYKLCEAGPEPLVPPELRFGASERTGPEGPLVVLDEEATTALLEHLANAEPEAVAVALLHSYAHPAHEQRIGELLADRLPYTHVSLSHELVGTFREYERSATTEVDAALSPLLQTYLERLGTQATAEGLPAVQVMQSSGGLTDSHRAASHAALTVLSGPAGGVGGALLLSEATGTQDVLCFDMGGTSCDVCVIDEGRVAETAQREVAGRPLALPALDIHTVGAGGGSIAWRDAGGALRVGPESAGADPGPACYGKGGERATVTDANLVLGRLLADTPLAGGVRLDLDAAERTVEALACELGLEKTACAEGIVRVAEAEMRRALAVMTVERGIDPRRFALMPFGGAGPLHAASMAAELGIGRVLCPRACGVLSALGLAAATPRRDAARTVMLSGTAFTDERVKRELDALIERAVDELEEPASFVRVHYELRYRGQSFELSVEAEIGDLRAAFEDAHEARYGYRDEGIEVELVTIRVSALGARPELTLDGATRETPERASTPVVFDGERVEAELWLGELPSGAPIVGPAVCAMPESTLLVPPGWHGIVDERGTVLLERVA